ncbi:hypothetical protein D917_04299, partial [Trichinella nativa]
VTSPPFEVTETGYAGFVIPITIYLAHCKREYYVEYDMNLRYVPDDRIHILKAIELKNPTPALRQLVQRSMPDHLSNSSKPRQPVTSHPTSSFQDLFGEPIQVNSLEKYKISKNSMSKSSKNKKTTPTITTSGSSTVSIVQRSSAEESEFRPSLKLTVKGLKASQIIPDKEKKVKLSNGNLDSGLVDSKSMEKSPPKPPSQKKLMLADFDFITGKPLLSVQQDVDKSILKKKIKIKKRQKSDSGLDTDSTDNSSMGTFKSPLSKPAIATVGQHVDEKSAAKSVEKKKQNSNAKIQSLKDESIAQKIVDIIVKHTNFNVVSPHFLEFDLSQIERPVINSMLAYFNVEKSPDDTPNAKKRKLNKSAAC